MNATRTNAGKEPRAWAEFLNEVAQMIHELDPDHPVAVGNLGSGLAETYNQYAPAIDVFGMTAYMGQGGFGNSWNLARTKFDRPVLIIEYGCDAYAEGKGAGRSGAGGLPRGMPEGHRAEPGGRRTGRQLDRRDCFRVSR